MIYLFNALKKTGKAHLWSDAIDGLGMPSDTYCHMWSTGGMKQNKKGLVWSQETDREICTMCDVNRLKQYRESD